MTYDTLKVSLLAALVRSQPPFTMTDGFFDTLYPDAIQYAEARIYKDMVLLATRSVNTSLLTISNNRSLDITGSGIIVPEGFALIDVNGNRIPFDKSTLDVIDEVWPSFGTALAVSVNDFVTKLWCLQDDHTIVFCPTQTAVYPVAITGLMQPAPLSPINETTYLSVQYPALLEAACMVFMSGAVNRNFGAQADTPREAVSWEGQYQMLLASSKSEEARRRGLVPDMPAPPAARAA